MNVLVYPDNHDEINGHILLKIIYFINIRDCTNLCMLSQNSGFTN